MTAPRLKTADIPIAEIDCSGRLRPVTKAVAEQLAQDIRARGLRQPIEVAPGTGAKKYRLVAGAHRLAACRLFGWTTIPAIVTGGGRLEQRRDELLENLARNELSQLERAQFLAELKRVYQELHPETRPGGTRQSVVSKGKTEQMANLAFCSAVAQRAEWAARTIRRATLVGERLSAEAAETIRGTAFEDNQAELEALSKQPPAVQVRVADLLTRKTRSVSSVAVALRCLRGESPKADDPDRDFKRLVDVWNRANGRTRARFLEYAKTQKREAA